MSGMLAGLCFCVTHPIESVKTRVQVADVTNEDRKGFFRAAARILKSEGLYSHQFLLVFWFNILLEFFAGLPKIQDIF